MQSNDDGAKTAQLVIRPAAYKRLLVLLVRFRQESEHIPLLVRKFFSKRGLPRGVLDDTRKADQCID